MPLPTSPPVMARRNREPLLKRVPRAHNEPRLNAIEIGQVQALQKRSAKHRRELLELGHCEHIEIDLSLLRAKFNCFPVGQNPTYSRSSTRGRILVRHQPETALRVVRDVPQEFGQSLR